MGLMRSMGISPTISATCFFFFFFFFLFFSSLYHFDVDIDIYTLSIHPSIYLSSRPSNLSI